MLNSQSQEHNINQAYRMLVVMAVLAGVLVIVWLKYFRSHPPFPQRDPRMLEALGLHHPQASQFAVAKYEGLP